IISYTQAEINSISLFREVTTLFSEVYTSISSQRSDISELIIYYSISLLAALSSSQLLYFYIYNSEKKIKMRDSLKYKNKILFKYYSFIQTL
ncbi:hypothetical protein EMPG_09385, partial [Blastomyces silverae]